MFGIFGFNEQRIMENKKPLVSIEVTVTYPIYYEDQFVKFQNNPGSIIKADLYANCEGELYLGDVPSGGGYVTLTVPLQEYMNCLSFNRTLKINANMPYNNDIRNALNNIENFYGIRL